MFHASVLSPPPLAFVVLAPVFMACAVLPSNSEGRDPDVGHGGQEFSWWWEGNTAPLGEVSNPAVFGNVAFEKRFEQEYWDIISRSDARAMDGWTRRAIFYVERSNSPRSGRFAMLVGGAGAFLFRENNFPRYLDAATWSRRANELLPKHLNTVAFRYGLSSFQSLALGQDAVALKDVEKMLASPGTEEKVAAALTLGLAKGNRYVGRALEILADCRTEICNRTTQLAPFKSIGMLLALAELYAKTGDEQKFEEALARAEVLAAEQRWPFWSRFQKLRDEVGGKKVQWDRGWPSIGSLALPLASYTESATCTGCHFGAKVKESDYAFGSDSHNAAP